MIQLLNIFFLTVQTLSPSDVMQCKQIFFQAPARLQSKRMRRSNCPIIRYVKVLFLELNTSRGRFFPSWHQKGKWRERSLSPSRLHSERGPSSIRAQWASTSSFFGGKEAYIRIKFRVLESWQVQKRWQYIHLTDFFFAWRKARRKKD